MTNSTRSHRRRWITVGLLLPLLLYPLISYVLLPEEWLDKEGEMSISDAPIHTVNAYNIPDDPLNIGLIGSETMLKQTMAKAGWYQADDLSPLTRIAILFDILFRRSYPTAPVSKMFLWKRKQDIAFELPIGASPGKRHHVRFWRSTITTQDGSPLWIGAVTLDRGIGFNHFTGQLTHHIGPDTNAEREFLLANITTTEGLAKMYQVGGTGSIRAKNAQGDPYETDGILKVGLLTSRHIQHLTVVSSAYPLDWRNKDWGALRTFLQN